MYCKTRRLNGSLNILIVNEKFPRFNAAVVFLRKFLHSLISIISAGNRVSLLKTKNIGIEGVYILGLKISSSSQTRKTEV
jgi:hypothetical protein